MNFIYIGCLWVFKGFSPAPILNFNARIEWIPVVSWSPFLFKCGKNMQHHRHLTLSLLFTTVRVTFTINTKWNHDSAKVILYIVTRWPSQPLGVSDLIVVQHLFLFISQCLWARNADPQQLTAVSSVTCAASNNVAPVAVYITCRSEGVCFLACSSNQNIDQTSKRSSRGMQCFESGVNDLVRESWNTVKSGQQQQQHWPLPDSFSWCPQLFMSLNYVKRPQDDLSQHTMVSEVRLLPPVGGSATNHHTLKLQQSLRSTGLFYSLVKSVSFLYSDFLKVEEKQMLPWDLIRILDPGGKMLRVKVNKCCHYVWVFMCELEPIAPCGPSAPYCYSRLTDVSATSGAICSKSCQFQAEQPKGIWGTASPVPVQKINK